MSEYDQFNATALGLTVPPSSGRGRVCRNRRASGRQYHCFSNMGYSVLEKALELLKQTSPQLDRVAFMFNPDTYPNYDVYLQKLGGIRQLGFDLRPLRVRSEAENDRILKGAIPGVRGAFHLEYPGSEPVSI